MKMFRNFKRDTKALSPVIATLLLVAVTVVAVVGTYVWYGDVTGTAGATVGAESDSSVTSMFDDTSSGLVADMTVSTNPDRITYERWSVDLPEWKPMNDSDGIWDYDCSYSDNNELCGCCDAIGILGHMEGQGQEDNLDAFAHEGAFLPVKVSITNNGKKVMNDAKVVIPETPHDNCWWTLHAEEDDEGNLVWTFPDGTMMDTYFGVESDYTAAKVAGGASYATYENATTGAGIKYIFNGYKVTHAPLALGRENSTYAGIPLSVGEDNTDPSNAPKWPVGPGLEDVGEGYTTPGSEFSAERENSSMPYLTMIEKLPYQTKVVVTDSEAFNSSTVSTLTASDEDEFLFDSVSAVVCEDYLLRHLSDNIYEVGTVLPGQTKDVWIVLGIRHFDVSQLELGTYSEGFFYDLPMKVYVGDELKEDTAIEMYFHDTGEETTAHA